MRLLLRSRELQYNNPKPISLWRRPVGGVNGSGGKELGIGVWGVVVLDQKGSVAVSLAQQRSRLEILRLLFNFSLTQRLDIRSF